MPDLSSSLRDLIERSARPFDVDAIVGVRRRRRLRRRLTIGTAVVVIVAVVTGGILARPVHEPAKVSAVGPTKPELEAAATRAALAPLEIVSPAGGTSALQSFSSAPRLNVTDPASGSTRSIPFPVPGALGLPVPFIVQGSQVVMVVAQKFKSFGINEPAGAPVAVPYAASSSFQQWALVSGGSISSAFAALDGGVWLVSGAGTQYADVAESALGVGSPNAGPYRLTRGRTPIAAVDGGMLTWRPSGSHAAPRLYEVWNPVTGKAVRVLGAFASPVAVSTSHLAWIDGVCPSSFSCSLHIGDVRTPFVRIVSPPRGMQWTGTAAFSPDGTQLAIVAEKSLSRQEIESDSLIPPPGKRAALVAVFNTASGQETTRSTSSWRRGLTISWSPDGSLVLFTRDATHVGYFNAGFAKSQVETLSVPDADAFVVLPKPAPAPPASEQRWSYTGRVVADALHSAELCIYATADDLSPYSDSCGGPLVVGWNVKHVSGTFHLVGTYDGKVFTLTQPPNPPVTTTAPTTPSTTPASSPTTSPPAGFASGCPTPPGGWRVTDPAKVTIDTYNAVTGAAQAAPDYVGTWVGPYTSYPGVADSTLAVLNFAFTGNLDAHRQALSAIYGGPICVVQRGTHTQAELQAIVAQLFGAYGRSLGLDMLEGGPDGTLDVVHAQAIAVTPAMRAAIDRRFGPGVVNLSSVLTPLP